MKFKKLGSKILVVLLPIMIIAQGAMTIISGINSSNLIDDEVALRMQAELSYNEAQIDSFINEVETMCMDISVLVGDSVDTLTWNDYESILTNIIKTNDSVLGSGLWFEPYAYDDKEMYYGPYVYKDGSSVVTTWDYSNADYDYFAQDYYINALASDDVCITDPYYDPTSGLVMSSCSAPIVVNGKKIGCVTVDISCDTIDSIVSQIKVGETGYAILLSNIGYYLSGADEEKIATGFCIFNEENESLVEAANLIFQGGTGETTYKEGKTTYDLYYDALELTGWKLVICMEQYELVRPVYILINKLIAVLIGAVAFVAIIMILQIGGITKSIERVRKFAGELAGGDFTIAHLSVIGQDELANMSGSLNNMYDHNKRVIQNISDHSNEISESSGRLSTSANELQQRFNDISRNMASINEAMMNSSAATQELTASVEQVDNSVEVLSGEANKSLEKATDIKNRAAKVEADSQNSYKKAENLKDDFAKKLEISIESAKVVENIDEMAQIISDIAEEINLLSLNASIEAARAGEQGKGFAVVASEIGKLAGETANAVASIQTTITQVQEAFENLAGNANGLLGFVTDTVEPDYKSFVEVASQYGNDAQTFSEISNQISEMSENINKIMDEITKAIQNIAESTQNTADISSNIMDSVDSVSHVVNEVSEMSERQNDISTELNSVVAEFKI